MKLVNRLLRSGAQRADLRSLGDQSAKLRQSGWWHSFTFPDGEQVEGVRSELEMRQHLDCFGLPARLDGKRVLDIGAWDGWFSFEMERRGAAVTAVDCWDNPNFHRAKAKFGSAVRYVQCEVYDIHPATLGTFDIVLFFGVLYHLKHPLLALEKVCAVTKDFALIETFVTDEHSGGNPLAPPRLEFYETGELSGQVDNWTGPNLSCLLAFCRVAGFILPDLRTCRDHRAFVRCQRSWPTPETASGPAPILEKIEHARFGGINFDSRQDEYFTAWFRWQGDQCGREHLRLNVGGFGCVPLSVTNSEQDPSLWQTAAKVPPGLVAGYHPVTLAISQTAASNPIDLAIDVHESVTALTIAGVCDGETWTPDAVRMLPDGTCRLALWIAGLPRNADVGRVRLRIDGEAHRPSYVEPGGPEARVRQVNCSFVASPAESFELQVEVEGAVSPLVRVARPDVKSIIAGSPP